MAPADAVVPLRTETLDAPRNILSTDAVTSDDAVSAADAWAMRFADA
jgi:hypothetical protein